MGNRKPTVTSSNETNYFNGRLKVVVWPFLTNSDAWFVLADKRYGAPVSFKRRPVTFGRDGEFDTGDIKIKSTMRYSYGTTDWRWCYGYDT